MSSFTVQFVQDLVVSDFLRAKGISESALPRKTFEPIRAIQFQDGGVARVVTEKRSIVYRVPQPYIQAYRYAKDTPSERIERAALDALLLHILRTPSSIQIQGFIPKVALNDTSVAEVKRELHQRLCEQLNNPNTEICDFIEFDSFDDAAERAIVGVTYSRPVPHESLALTTALPVDLYEKLRALQKS